MKFRNWIVQLLGLFTTLLSIALIYLILFKDGHLRELTIPILVEFMIVTSLTISAKFFWYTSTENAVRSSDDYINKRNIVAETISTEIDDATQFDEFIDNENEANFNRYVSNRCRNMTVDNYRLSLFDKIHRIFHHDTDKRFYMTRYVLRVERKANKLHKLSGSCIRSLTTSIDGLTDDRNKATAKKITFLWSGAIFSFAFMFITATIAFTNKEDTDTTQAVTKMIIYVSNILFSILQAVLKARITVVSEDIAYFNKILSILEKYAAYKKDPKSVQRVSYIPLEVKNVDNNSTEQKEINDVTVGRSGGSRKV
jgi:hypothetical protein